MALSIIATAGAADANSYLTVAEFAEYLEGRFGVPSAVLEAPDALREQALVAATRRIDAEHFVGARSSSLQSLAWPRYGAPDPDAAHDSEGGLLDSQTVPRKVKEATAEQAIKYLAAGSDTDPDAAASDSAEAQGIESVKVGTIAVDFATPQSGLEAAVEGALTAGELAPATIRLLRGLRVLPQAGSVSRRVRG